jgi:HEAT repeat protein
VDWLGRERSDTVPGLTPPSERIAALRKMGRKAGWANADEQERISGQLAAAFPVEADPLIRLEIVRALAGHPTAAAASTLDAALDDSDADVRIAACKVWGERGGPEGAAKLKGVLASDLDQDVRLAAARALGETGDPAAVSALGEALEDNDPAMQYRAVQSLRSVTGEDFGHDVDRWRQYVQGELPAREKPEPIVQRFRRLF